MPHLIGKRIRLARIEAEISQLDLAEKVGTTQRSISGWELGKTAISAEMLARIATVLDKDPAWFFTPFQTRSDAAPEGIPIQRRREEDWPQYEKAAPPKSRNRRQVTEQAARKVA